ncbi:MAG: hypothetical protein ABL893_12595 [Hyphomicrobium sp.]
MKLAEQDLEVSKAVTSACEKQLAECDARKAGLERRVADDQARLAVAEEAALRARVAGMDGVSRDDAARLRDDIALTAKALVEVGREREALLVERDTARLAETTALGVVQRLAAADALDELAPVFADAFERIAAVDPAGTFMLAGKIAEVVKVERGAPDRIAQRIKTAGDELRSVITQRRLAEKLEPVTAAPARDTPVFSNRSFRYAFRDGTDTTIPSRWVGFVPEIVASRLVKIGAAELLPKMSMYRAESDFEIKRSDLRIFLTAGKKYPLVDREVIAANAQNVLVKLSDEVGVEHYRTQRAEAHAFRNTIDLGVIDAPGVGEAEQVSNVPTVAVEPLPPSESKPRRRPLVRDSRAEL